jgi:hypothetical protein
MTRKKWLALIFIAPPAIALFIWMGGELVMHLWNWLAPALFGWRLITFWQALALLALCRILFGSHGFRGSHQSGMRRQMRERMEERWEKMTPEEREKFRHSWRSRCGGFEPPLSRTPSGDAKESD